MADETRPGWILRAWPAVSAPRLPKVHAPKGVPPDAFALVGDRAGVWLVRTDLAGRSHHAIVAVGPDGAKATHGGCFEPDRAAHFAHVHRRLYGLTDVVLDEAAPSVKRIFERGSCPFISSGRPCGALLTVV